MIYEPAKFEVAMSDNVGGDAFLRKNICDLWPLKQCHMKYCSACSVSAALLSYIPAKFEVVTFNSVGGDTFTRKYMF